MPIALARLEKAVSLLGSREPGDALVRAFIGYASKDSGADMSALYLLAPDERLLTPTMTLAVPPRVRRRLEPLRVGEGACGRAVSRNVPVVIADAAAERDGFAGGFGARLGIRSLYATPVPSSDGRPLGAIAHLFRAPHRPSDEELIVSGLYSRLVATVIERVRLRDQAHVRDALDEQRRSELVSGAGLVLESSLDYRATLENVARAALPWLADACVVNVLEERGLERAAAAHHVRRSAHALRDAFPFGAPASAPEAACALERRAERVTGADADRILAPGARRKLGLRSLVVVPLAAGSRPIGVLTLAARRDFSDADLRTAEAYARRAALAIAHARSHEEARRALAARDELLAIVAHDLQNLIATIGLSATLLARVERDGDRRRGGKQIELIRSTNERMRHLVGDLLDGARMESGRFTLRPTRSTMGSLLRAAAEIAQPLADERGLRLVCDPADEEVELRCDEPRVLQVLTNLLRNAIKFTPRGTVTLRARRHGGEARFEVVDQGVGVPPEQAARVFERYWTIDGQQGTGLGLYIARHIVEAHGGALRLDSAPGRGSTFWFTLPLAPAAKPKDARR